MGEVTELQSLRWWRAPSRGNRVGGMVTAAINAIQESTMGWQMRLNANAKRYGGWGYMSTGRFNSTSVAGSTSGRRAGPRDNIIYVLVDSCVAQLVDEGVPTVSFLTNHGDFELQQKAKKLTRFNDGLRYAVRFDAEARRVLTDAAIFGIGLMKHYIGTDDEILNERTFPSEIFVGMWDGRDMRPRSLYQVGFCDRDLLAARFPEKKSLILDGSSTSIAPKWAEGRAYDNNIIAYAEAWHLPSSKTANDGRHVLCLSDDDVLTDEDWTATSFPFSVLRFADLPTGYQGIGIAEICQGDQSALNDANLAEYWAWSQFGMPRVAFQTGTVDINKLNSSLSGILLEIDGPAPQVLNWSATHPDFVAWKKDLKLTAFNRVGISPTTAGGEKPIGLNSGEAQRVYADQKKTRFAVLNQRWQEFQVEACKQNIRLAGRLVEENGSFEVKVLGKNTFEVLDLADFHLEEDEYRMQILPVSELPKTFAGRLQTVTEMLQAQLIDPDTGRRLLQLPDLDSAEDEVNAAKDHAERVAYQLLYTDDEVHPDIMLEGVPGVQLCIVTVTAQLTHAIDSNAPPDKIQRCMTWLAQARGAIKSTQPPPAPPGPAPGGAPPLAKGATPPVNPMLPFAAPKAA